MDNDAQIARFNSIFAVGAIAIIVPALRREGVLNHRDEAALEANLEAWKVAIEAGGDDHALRLLAAALRALDPSGGQ